MAFTQNLCSRYGHCDSFFTESDDDLYAARAESRDRARVFAKARQRAIAEELSRLTSEEYVDDVLNHMEFMEVSALRLAAYIVNTYVQFSQKHYLM